MIKFRTGPHMGIPYQEARALGLSSALQGPEFYEKYVSRVQVKKPSERLLGVRCGFPYVEREHRPLVTLSGLLSADRVTAPECRTDYIVGLMKACAESFKAPKEWHLPVPFDVLKPARREKPE